MSNAAAIESEVEPIGVRRRRLERQLADLRRARGQAVADGKKFDSTKITAVEASLGELDDAEAELERREETQRPALRRASYEASMEIYVKATERRLDAVAKVQAAASVLAAAMREAIDATAATYAACGVMSSLIGPKDDSAPQDLTSFNFDNRLWAGLRGVLRRAFGRTSFGSIDLAQHPDDPGPDDSWSALEARHGDVLPWFKRHLPPA